MLHKEIELFEAVLVHEEFNSLAGCELAFFVLFVNTLLTSAEHCFFSELSELQD